MTVVTRISAWTLVLLFASGAKCCDDDTDWPCEPEPGDSCELPSINATTCAPPTLGTISVSVSGLSWTDPDGLYIGTADCTVDTSSALGSMTTLELSCVHVLGDPIEPTVTITIDSLANVTPTLHPGRAVRLQAAAFVSDEDSPSVEWYAIERPDDGALLLAWTHGYGDVIPWPSLLGEIGLAPEDWLAPLSAELVGGLCPEQPAYCLGVRERGAIELEIAGHDPARILDHRSGTVDGGYDAYIGDAEYYSTPGTCVDDQPRSDFLVVARADCP